MQIVRIPPNKIETVQSRECEAWVVENCPHNVQGHVGEDGGFALRFDEKAEAEAFRLRWLL
ncbi:hypothetical protein [Sphingosinicella sp. BN140058]|uniref:hypothetical protein n=1 Tax=Sphingosinicella sp. BN140058 TaxID=1892855 RepID=UPI0010127E89|nr:hypothetical protein [Sphingosinicella sp. BN140058]QAY77942.1 hypothetical protein ETR14_16480 [Sphingosinicella sp. BN140058]